MRRILLASTLAACTSTPTSETKTMPTPAAPANPLLADWTGPYDGVPPWDKVRADLFPSAFQASIDERRAELLAIADSKEPPTFANTIEALEKIGQRLDHVSTLFGVMTGNLATPEIQALDKEWSPKLAA